MIFHLALLCLGKAIWLQNDRTWPQHGIIFRCLNFLKQKHNFVVVFGIWRFFFFCIFGFMMWLWCFFLWFLWLSAYVVSFVFI